MAKFTQPVAETSLSLPVMAAEEEDKPCQSEAKVATGWHGGEGGALQEGERCGILRRGLAFFRGKVSED